MIVKKCKNCECPVQTWEGKQTLHFIHGYGDADLNTRCDCGCENPVPEKEKV